MNASEWPMACSHLVASFKATEASSSSPALEGKATLKSFLRRLPGSILDGEVPPTYMLPALLGIWHFGELHDKILCYRFESFWFSFVFVMPNHF
jgi:hypothetical protein